MNTKLRVTKNTFSFTDPNSAHEINCRVNNIDSKLLIMDSELVSLGLYQNDKLLGYIGRSGITQNYSTAELINGRYEPIVYEAPKGTTIKVVERFKMDPLNNNIERKSSSVASL